MARKLLLRAHRQVLQYVGSVPPAARQYVRSVPQATRLDGPGGARSQQQIQQQQQAQEQRRAQELSQQQREEADFFGWEHEAVPFGRGSPPLPPPPPPSPPPPRLPSPPLSLLAPAPKAALLWEAYSPSQLLDLADSLMQVRGGEAEGARKTSERDEAEGVRKTGQRAHRRLRRSAPPV